MEIVVGGVVLATALVLGNEPYEDPAKYSTPVKPAACYSYGGSNMRSGYGSGIVIYHCPGAAKIKAEARNKVVSGK